MVCFSKVIYLLDSSKNILYRHCLQKKRSMKCGSVEQFQICEIWEHFGKLWAVSKDGNVYVFADHGVENQLTPSLIFGRKVWKEGEKYAMIGPGLFVDPAAGTVFSLGCKSFTDPLQISEFQIKGEIKSVTYTSDKLIIATGDHVEVKTLYILEKAIAGLVLISTRELHTNLIRSYSSSSQISSHLLCNRYLCFHVSVSLATVLVFFDLNTSYLYHVSITDDNLGSQRPVSFSSGESLYLVGPDFTTEKITFINN